MKKIGIIIVVLLLVGASFLSGCIDEPDDDSQAPPTTTSEITLDEAIAILMDKILKPGYSNNRASAFMTSKVLQKDDVVTSEVGDTYPIDSNTWFVFIDDDPKLFFSHPTRYVFINAQDGSYDISNELWPPLINDFSMWDTANLNRGDIIEIFPVLNSSVSISSGVSNTYASTGDYGDAPDGQNAYYGVQGRFPTLYNTTNSVLNRPGGHTLTVGEEMLGLNVSAEVDANDPNDPDLVPNLVDSDKDERMFINVNVQDAQLFFTATVDEDAPDVTRYVNVLIDFDQDGNWTKGSYGSEWPVINFEVNVTPGTSKTITTPWFSWGTGSDLPSPVWIRVALTREELDESLF